MGTAIDHCEFSAEDYQRFSSRLQENLQALHALLSQPGFGTGPASLGAELELYLVDSAGRPAFRNQDILRQAADPLLTLELNRYNLEYNFAPLTAQAGALRSLETAISDALSTLNTVAQTEHLRVVPIGILPTLQGHDFGEHAMTDAGRYQCLTHTLKQQRQGPFHIHIQGAEPLELAADSVTLEGANTSLQIHYRIDPEQFADFYNALQIATPIVLGLAANSPTFLGHRLWQESRIPLFKQSIDSRPEPAPGHWHQPSRVSFGHGWLRHSAFELFAECTNLFPPLLPISDAEDSLACIASGGIPKLAEMRLHQSTVWLWNRPVYDPAAGGHLRVEMRALPAGPTAPDMVANAAFLLGLGIGLMPALPHLLPALPFSYAQHNLYRAAQHGLQASLVWPRDNGGGLCEKSLPELARELLPIAAHGLDQIGISQTESRYYLGIIDDRINQQCNGASWQLAVLDKLEEHYPRTEALQRMLELYIDNANSGQVVSQWSLHL